MKLILNQRQRYLIISILTVVSLFLFSSTHGVYKNAAAILAFAVAVLGSAYVQYTSVKTQGDQEEFVQSTLLNILTLPVILVIGSLLSLVYFPNLGLPIRTVVLLVIGGLMYLISLVNNIFLVVYERGEVIPLYRVAVTWSQILLIIVSIPFFAGVFKVPFNSIAQTLVVSLTAGLLALFFIWIQVMDPDVPKISRGEKAKNSLLVGYIVALFSFGTAFFPAEPFLRALLISAALMSSLGYLQAHYKNVVTKKLVFEYIFITFIFLFLVVVF